MANHPWYPLGQICSPPELPAYLKDVYNLSPIIGMPSDNDVIGIHSVIHAANRVSVVPGMDNPRLLMSLADHLFSVQMAKYRSKYSLLIFPSNAVYTPPTLPAHLSVSLEPVSGAPTDAEIMQVQDAVQTYQGMRRFPSMFDAHVNMELSQHLFDLQMARYMRLACEGQQGPVPQQKANLPRPTDGAAPVDVETFATNNAETGKNVAGQNSHLLSSIDAQGLMERSNGLTERSSQILQSLNRMIERSHPPSGPTRCSKSPIAPPTNSISSPNDQNNCYPKLIDQYNDQLGSRSNSIG
ncbi:putative laminin domain protein [Rhizoctonia solani 123E]|uniref:Putative laminin domain protein n=1 Tax=Rhizoctonia solani 123E TaxID=1423351 RepID=A0A074RD27_9AGAM|nr:putative laminin domain protein [Rhizoctonia solani 123E]